MTTMENRTKDPKPSGGADQAVGDGVFHQIGGRMQIEQFHDLGLVKFDGSMGDSQLAGDFLRGESFRHKLNNLALSGR